MYHDLDKYNQGLCLFTPDASQTKQGLPESRNRVREALNVRPRPERASEGHSCDMRSIFLDGGDEKRVMRWTGSDG